MSLFKKKDDDAATVTRLSSHAGNIIQMLKQVLGVHDDSRRWHLLAYACGLAGYACHLAVKANHGSFMQVETKSGKKYYFGDDVNQYLLESKHSVLNYMSGAYSYISPGKALPDVVPIIQNAASVIGNEEYRLWNRYAPEEVFRSIKDCWDGIYDNMTAKYCKTPSEWPILFGIVLQNIMIELMKSYSPESVFIAALECTIFISKMDVDSL